MDLFSVISNLPGVIFDLLFGPLNSLDEIGESNSGGFNSDKLVRVNVNLMFIAIIVDGGVVDVETIYSVSEAVRGDRGKFVSGSSGENSSESVRLHRIQSLLII